ncbi:MAG: GNAT family N-acetyltransferase [Thermoplasmata archaeon]|nr:GNAT family N-acetyltransferase [Thermoplasmata archaeon]
MIALRFAESEEDMLRIRELFLEYASSLGFSLGFQNFDDDIMNLPGKYGRPKGRLILALDDEEIVGCVALREFDKDICELKRLYVKKESRGKGIGKLLTEKVIDEAISIGYSRMRLDTIDNMTQAMTLYRSMGFKEINAYRENPIEGARYFELILK